MEFYLAKLKSAGYEIENNVLAQQDKNQKYQIISEQVNKFLGIPLFIENLIDPISEFSLILQISQFYLQTTFNNEILEKLYFNSNNLFIKIQQQKKKMKLKLNDVRKKLKNHGRVKKMASSSSGATVEEEDDSVIDKNVRPFLREQRKLDKVFFNDIQREILFNYRCFFEFTTNHTSQINKKFHEFEEKINFLEKKYNSEVNKFSEEKLRFITQIRDSMLNLEKKNRELNELKKENQANSSSNPSPAPAPSSSLQPPPSSISPSSLNDLNEHSSLLQAKIEKLERENSELTEGWFSSFSFFLLPFPRSLLPFFSFCLPSSLLSFLSSLLLFLSFLPFLPFLPSSLPSFLPSLRSLSFLLFFLFQRGVLC